MRRSIYWCKLLNVDIRRVYEDIISDIPPWEAKVQVINSYDESQVYNNETFLEYVNFE